MMIEAQEGEILFGVVAVVPIEMRDLTTLLAFVPAQAKADATTTPTFNEYLGLG